MFDFLLNREGAQGGFSTLSAFKEHNYDHDVDTLKLSAANVYHSIKKLPKLQKDIKRKSEKRKSKYLQVNKEDYDGCMKTVLEGLKCIKEASDNIYNLHILLVKANLNNKI